VGYACASLAKGLHSQLVKAKIGPQGKQDLMRKLFQCAAKDLEDKLRQVCPVLTSVHCLSGFIAALVADNIRTNQHFSKSW